MVPGNTGTPCSTSVNPASSRARRGHVIGIDRQAARGHEQIGPGLLDFPDRFGDARHIVRGNDRAHHLTVELMRLGRDDRDEFVLNDALKNFRPGNKDAHFGLAQGQDFEKRLFPKRGKRLSETAAGNIQRNGACPGKARTLAHHRGVLPRGHHDLRSMLKRNIRSASTLNKPSRSAIKSILPSCGGSL